MIFKKRKEVKEWTETKRGRINEGNAIQSQMDVLRTSFQCSVIRQSQSQSEIPSFYFC